MLTFTNSGPCGTGFSTLEVSVSSDVLEREALSFRRLQDTKSIILGVEQVIALRDDLARWIASQRKLSGASVPALPR